MILIDGKKLSELLLQNIQKEVAMLPFQPVFSDVLVGDDFASEKYVKMKMRVAERIGMKFHNASFPATITTDALVEAIQELNQLEHMCGIIVQLPLPETVDMRRALDAIDVSLDVDALGTETNQKFYNGEKSFGLPTALACMYILENLHLDLHDKNIVVLGYGELVGKPVAALLTQKGFNPIIVQRHTEQKEEILKNADVIISGIGKGMYIKGDMIKKGAVIIDAGTSESGSVLVGDVDLESVKDVAGYVSPVPGGVGPLTIAMLFKNVLEVAKRKQHE